MLGNGHVRFGGRGRANDHAQARHRGSPSTLRAMVTVEVTADGEGFVSHAGSALLVQTRAGSRRRYRCAWRASSSASPGTTPCRVVRDLAVMLADGGDCLADLGAVRDQDALFGAVASDSTAFRVIDQRATITRSSVRYSRPLDMAGLIATVSRGLDSVAAGAEFAGLQSRYQ
jgi:hypothetical protein